MENLNCINLQDYCNLSTANLIGEQPLLNFDDDDLLEPTRGDVFIRFLPRLCKNNAKLDDLFIKEHIYVLEKDGKTVFNFKQKSDDGQTIERCVEGNVKFIKKTIYYCLVYVFEDSQNHQNDGHYKVYKFDDSIYQTLNTVCEPTYEETMVGIEPLNFWDLKNGATFHIKAQKLSNGYSKFLKSTPFTTGTLKYANTNNVLTNTEMSNEFKRNWVLFSKKLF